MWEADYTSIDSYLLAVIYLKSIEHINSLCTEIKFYFISPCHLKLERYMFVRVTENFRISLIFVKIWLVPKTTSIMSQDRPGKWNYCGIIITFFERSIHSTSWHLHNFKRDSWEVKTGCIRTLTLLETPLPFFIQRMSSKTQQSPGVETQVKPGKQKISEFGSLSVAIFLLRFPSVFLPCFAVWYRRIFCAFLCPYMVKYCDSGIMILW